MSNKTKIFILSNTHWDREWYMPFQGYRFKLVRVIDELLDVLLKNPDYKHFHFDGQTVLIEDYLKIRPERAEELYSRIKEGRILIGPWYTMPDEFLISGEGLVRNLQKGINICKDLGVKCCNNGYVSDIFGHNSQMPQIFKGVGIDNAALFRGFAKHRRDNIIWEGADGTECITHFYHPDYAYSTFFFVVRWPFEDKDYTEEEIVARVGKYLEREKQYFTGGYHMMVDGIDHVDACMDTPRLIDILNRNFPDYEFLQSNFADYTGLVRKDKDKLERHKGAIYETAYEGVNNRLLKNVLSSQVHLKQQNDALESGLTLDLEPLAFWAEYNEKKFAPQKHYRSSSPRVGYFDEAWRYILQNQAHDSICGCSITETHYDNEYRYKQAREITAAVKKDLFAQIAPNVSVPAGKDGAILVYNPSQLDIKSAGIVELFIKNGTHQRNFELFDKNGQKLEYNIIGQRQENIPDLRFNGLNRFTLYDILSIVVNLDIKAYGFETIGYNVKNNVRTMNDGNWRFDEYYPRNRNLGSMRVSPDTVDNGRIIVSVNNNGTLRVTDKKTRKIFDKLLSFEDCGDIGDGWNYIKPSMDGEFLSGACAADVVFLNDTPDFTRLRITNRFMIPIESKDEGRSRQLIEMPVISEVSILRGDSKITVKTAVENRAVNHRLRAVFPTGLKTEKFRTSLPFDLYEWDIDRGDYSAHIEYSGVNPNQGAVSLSDGESSFTLYNKGIYEIAVSKTDDKALYLTLFRSFTKEIRKLEADTAKQQRKMEFEYALDFEHGLSASDILKRANAFKNGLSCAEIPAKTDAGNGNITAQDSFVVRISGGAVLSSLKNGVTVDGEQMNVIRLFDVDGASRGEITFQTKVSRAFIIDLKNDRIKEAAITPAGAVKYSLGKKEIISIAFSF